MKAMKRGEVTMMVLVDFSKAFDTVRFGKTYHKDEQSWIVKKLSYLDA